MKNFTSTYKTNPNEAKRQYYLTKLKFDVNNQSGKEDLH